VHGGRHQYFKKFKTGLVPIFQKRTKAGTIAEKKDQTQSKKRSEPRNQKKKGEREA